jgi:hypothetical protein
MSLAAAFFDQSPSLQTAARHFTGRNLTTKGNLDVFERVYYIRAIIGIIAGVTAGLVIPFDPAGGLNQGLAVGTTIGIAFVFYFISFGVARGIAKNVPKDKRKKVALDGVVPFIFLLLTFMIIVYTALHQSVVLS